MTVPSDDFGFRSFDDLIQDQDEFGFISEYNIKAPKESLGANITRQAGRSGARVAETLLGAPRALGEFGEMLIPEKLIKKGAEKLGFKEPVEKGFEFVKEHAPYKLFPSSEQVKDFNKFLFGKKVEPQNKWEEKADTLISDFAALAIPLPGSKLRLLKPGLLAAGGNIASEAVGKIGGTEKEKTYAKLGTILFGSMINPKSAEKLKNSLYDQAREARPSDAKVSTNILMKASDSLEKNLTKGDSRSTSKRKSLDLIKDIKSKVKNNEIEVEELEQFKRDINEARSGLYETYKTDKVGRKSAKRNLDSVSKLIDDTLKTYGKQNPEWESFYRPANEVHGAIAESYKARNIISKVANKYGKHAILPLLGIGHFAGMAPTIETTLAATGVGAAVLMGGEISSKIMKSPTLRKHYMNLINSALKEDVIAVEQNLKKLEKELED
jgi:hypothetical protein